MSQAAYIERYKQNANFNEEGELVYKDNYTYE